MILSSGFINSIDTAVLIPESMRLRENEGDDAAAAFLNFFLVVYLLIGIVFVILMYFFGTTVFGFISRFSEADILTYQNYFWAGSFFFIFHILTNYINTILTSLKYFSIPMIISSIKSGIAILCIFLLKADYDVMSIFLGGLIAYAFNLVVLLIVLRKTAGWKFVMASSGIRKTVRRNIFYAELGQIATVASSMFPLYLLSGLGGGVISVMNYGKNIADIPNTLLTSQFSSVSGIKLNEQVAKQDHKGMNETFLSTSKFLVFVLVPVGFFLFVFARPIIEMFYMHGDFDNAAATGATVFLQLLGVSVFGIALNAMVTRVFIAMQAMKQAFIYQVIMNVLLIIAIWFFVEQYGAYGYGYAVIAINILNIGGMFLICRIVAPHVKYGVLARYTALIIFLNGIIATVVYVAADYLQIPILLKMIVLFTLWLFILMVLNKKLHLDFDIALWLNKKTAAWPI